MSEQTKATPGPWQGGVAGNHRVYGPDGAGEHSGLIAVVYKGRANVNLIAAAPSMYAELCRYLPLIERAESDPELWERLTAGTGIATANGYRDAIAKAGPTNG